MLFYFISNLSKIIFNASVFLTRSSEEYWSQEKGTSLQEITDADISTVWLILH